jgi:hypothetical protein
MRQNNAVVEPDAQPNAQPNVQPIVRPASHRRQWLAGLAAVPLASFLSACTSTSPNPTQPSADTNPALAGLNTEAQALRQAMQPLAPAVAEFLDQVPLLPVPQPQTLYRHSSTRAWLSAANWLRLPEDQRAAWASRAYDANAIYGHRYGTPLAYAMLLDVAARHGMRTLRGQHVVDYGYGALGPVRLMAQAGADVIGLDVDPVLGLLYGRDGQRSQSGPSATRGKMLLLQTNFPEPAGLADVGRNVNWFISKNTLKRGYLRPDEGQPEIKPPVDLPQYLQAVRGCMAKGGCMLIYNISLRQDPAKYRPANDPRSPFTRAEFEAAGFEVLALDDDEGPATRRMGRALGWAAEPAAGGMGDLDSNLFAMSTVARAA